MKNRKYNTITIFFFFYESLPFMKNTNTYTFQKYQTVYKMTNFRYRTSTQILYKYIYSVCYEKCPQCVFLSTCEVRCSSG